MDVKSMRVALVTGSSRGLGRSIVRRLAHDGFHVVVNGLRGDHEPSAVAQALLDEGHLADAVCADVTDDQQVTDLVTHVEERLGPIDVLVLNATGPQPEADLIDVSWHDHIDQLMFFLKSPVLLAREIVPSMRARQYGRIINIDSEVAHRPPPGRSAYVAAKNAQIGLTLAWARELASDGITVNAVAPGFIPVERHTDLPPDVTRRYLTSVPAGHMGTPDDIAHAVAFFASEQAAFITGQRIVVDGARRLG
jgi:3-oxoacyl-[acyl-carrier protein] reductase